MRKIYWWLKSQFDNVTVDRFRNKESAKLYRYFSKKHPSANRQIFLQLCEVSIKGYDLTEDPRELTKETAEKLKGRFSALSEDDLRNWLFGLMMQDGQKFLERMRKAKLNSVSKQ